MANVDFLQQADILLLQALNEPGGLQAFAEQVLQALQGIQQQGIAQSLVAQAYRASVTVRDLALFFQRFEQDYQHIKSWVLSEANNALKGDGLIARPSQSLGSNISASTSDALNSSILRQWFADHILDPSPDKEEKEDLVQRTNALPDGGLGGRNRKPLTYQQVVLWFINMRRRSGWTAFRRVYANSDTTRFEQLLKVIGRQPHAPPAGVKDDLATLMVEWNVSLQSEVDDAQSDDEEPARNNRHRAQPRRSTSSSTSKKSTASSKSVNKTDPKGIRRAKECREAYEKMMDFVSAGQKERVGDWLEDVLAGVESKPKSKRAIKSSSSKSSTATPIKVTERKTAALPTRASKRQQAAREVSTPVKASTSTFTPSVLATAPHTPSSPPRNAYLPGTELGPRLPSTFKTQPSVLPLSFWPSSTGSSAQDFSNLPTSAMSLTFSVPFPGFQNGIPATPRNASGGSMYSFTTDSTAPSQGSSQSSLSADSSQSSSSSLAYFASGIGIGDDSLVRSVGSSDASDVDGSSAPASTPDVKPLSLGSFTSMPSSSMQTMAWVSQAGDIAQQMQPQSKRPRAGNRPRHTDGGAPSTLLTFQHTQADIQNQPQQVQSPTQPMSAGTAMMNLNLHLSMFGHMGPAPLGMPLHQVQPQATFEHQTQHQQQPQANGMVGCLPNMGSTMGVQDLRSFYYQSMTPTSTNFPAMALYNNATFIHAPANPAMPTNAGMVGLRSVSDPERFTELPSGGGGMETFSHKPGTF